MNILAKPARNGRMVEIWYTGGKREYITPDLPPGFWSLYDRPGSVYDPRVLLSDTSKEVALWRYDCRTTYDQKRARDDPEALETRIPWIHALTMKYGFAQKNQHLKVAAWDLEAISGTGQFPNAKRDPIENVGYVSDTREEVLTGDEAAIGEGMVDIIRRDNPDLITTFNGGKFDWNYAASRFRRAKVDWGIGRLGDEPYIKVYKKNYGKFTGEFWTVWVGGRTIMDVYKEVRADTSLNGEVDSRGLKSVAKFFQKERPEENVIPEDLDIISVPYHKMHKLSKDVLNEYVLSDARATYHLTRHYLKVLTQLAVSFKAPLNLIVDRYPSHIGRFLYGSAFKQKGIVSDGPNVERFKGVLWY